MVVWEEVFQTETNFALRNAPDSARCHRNRTKHDNAVKHTTGCLVRSQNERLVELVKQPHVAKVWLRLFFFDIRAVLVLSLLTKDHIVAVCCLSLHVKVTVCGVTKDHGEIERNDTDGRNLGGEVDGRNVRRREYGKATAIDSACHGYWDNYFLHRLEEALLVVPLLLLQGNQNDVNIVDTQPNDNKGKRPRNRDINL